MSINRARLSVRFKNGNEQAGKVLANEIVNYSHPYTPHDKGTLEASGHPEIVDGQWAAVWGGDKSGVYAAYQWYGCWPDGTHQIHNHDTSINTMATTMWAEAAVAAHAKELGAIAQNEHVKGGNNGL